MRKDAPAFPDPPWVFAVAGLLSSLAIGVSAAVASHLAGLMVPESAAVRLAPWAVYVVAAAALIVSRTAVVSGRRKRLPWPFALGVLSGMALFASYYWPV